ncbi:DUF7005 family protein [Parapedobacter tibetensis]|uniref:DUF7005 family protein n=1 Tax=Parapedobacter tibetensis TaxID=2972951 RepID=UPI00214DDE18|nr:hypothetical protein [Parapedobacter tibetensis]
MAGLTERYELLKRYTTNPLVIKAVLGYTQNKFTPKSRNSHFLSFPLPDESYVSSWAKYEEESEKNGVFSTLKSYLPQLQFPIKQGISLSDEYRAATLSGTTMNNKASQAGLILNDAESLTLQIHQSIAGKIPVLTTANDDDFCSLIQALSHKNEPVVIPKSMGAALIKGINNWGRIKALRQKWQMENPFGNWKATFSSVVLPQKSNYQDNIIILSRKPYSGVSSQQLGIPNEQWLAQSMEIRLAHECTHLFTLRYYGHMANNMHDELLADYMGITEVLGKFNADWFLKFIGLERYPQYRAGARLENYLGKPPMAAEALEILKTILVKATKHVALFDEHVGTPSDMMDKVQRLLSLCSMDLVEMSSEQGTERLIAAYNSMQINVLSNG